MVITLQPFAAEDIPRLASWIDSVPAMVQWAAGTFAYPVDEEQLSRHFALTQGKAPVLRMFRVVDADKGEVVGHIELGAIDRANRTCTLSRVLVRPGCRGGGIGTEMVRAVLRVAFGEMGLHRVELRVFSFNEPAIRCYERCGFRREGLLRDTRIVEGRYWSSCVMGILEDEWHDR
jgi:RimJ/RimL family protein N-acetyltransferase